MLVGCVAYAFNDRGEHPIVDAASDYWVLALLLTSALIAGVLALIYLLDMVRLEITRGAVTLRTWTGALAVGSCYALDNRRLVVSTAGRSEMLFLAGLGKGAAGSTGAYAVAAACADNLSEPPTLEPPLVDRESASAESHGELALAGAPGSGLSAPRSVSLEASISGDTCSAACGRAPASR